ncbi:MAG: FAD-binding oxidoreductase [Archangium sp.]|nr:FAD-binding oxidoreductase [Archangium sp.]
MVALSGWGLYPTVDCKLVEPESERDVARALDVNGTIARGLGRSYGDPAINERRTVLGMTKLDRVLGFDDATGVLRCEAGVSLSQVIERFAGRGWFPMITPGTRWVTIGGCIANDVHGKAHHAQGSFLESVLSMRVLLASGDVVTASRTENADLFFASFGGMGLLGVIVEATIRLRKVSTTFFKQRVFVGNDLESLMQHIEEQDAAFPYSVASINPLETGARLGKGVLSAGDHASLEDLPEKFAREPLRGNGRAFFDMPFLFPNFTLNRATLSLVHVFGQQFMTRGAAITHADNFFYPLDVLVGDWNRGYGKRGFTQYQFVIPKEDGARNLRAILETIVSARQLPSLNVLKKLGKENAAPLSFPREGWTLAIDFPVIDGLAELLSRLDAMVADMGGRIYLGKDAFLDAATFARMYSRLPQWRVAKQKYDPHGVFTSNLSRRVGLT